MALRTPRGYFPISSIQSIKATAVQCAMSITEALDWCKCPTDARRHIFNKAFSVSSDWSCITPFHVLLRLLHQTSSTDHGRPSPFLHYAMLTRRKLNDTFVCLRSLLERATFLKPQMLSKISLANFAHYQRLLGFVIFFVEWPRPKRARGRTIPRMYKQHNRVFID